MRLSRRELVLMLTACGAAACATSAPKPLGREDLPRVHHLPRVGEVIPASQGRYWMVTEVGDFSYTVRQVEFRADVSDVFVSAPKMIGTRRA